MMQSAAPASTAEHSIDAGRFPLNSSINQHRAKKSRRDAAGRMVKAVSLKLPNQTERCFHSGKRFT
jgi:hypothetical protein